MQGERGGKIMKKMLIHHNSRRLWGGARITLKIFNDDCPHVIPNASVRSELVSANSLLIRAVGDAMQAGFNTESVD